MVSYAAIWTFVLCQTEIRAVMSNDWLTPAGGRKRWKWKVCKNIGQLLHSPILMLTQTSYI